MMISIFFLVIDGMRVMKKIRIGIDVGGTFTKAVAIDVLSKQIMEKCPSRQPIFRQMGFPGIVKVLSSLIEGSNINTEEIELISHRPLRQLTLF